MDILQLLAADHEILLYRKELNIITKKVTATILLQQIIYWHSKMGGPFYKFIEPCKNAAYKEGDSWCEELGFSVKEFRTAFKTLEDLGIVTSHTNMARLTTYTLRTEILSQLLTGIYVNAEMAVTQTPEGNLPNAETAVMQTPKGNIDITETTTETTSETTIIPPNPPMGNGGAKKRTKTLNLAEIADLHGFTEGVIEDFVNFRLDSGGIDTPDGFRKYLVRELSSSTSSEAAKLEKWFEASEGHKNVIDHLKNAFLSTQRFDRRFCRELAKDDLILKTHNIVPSDVVIEIAFQKAEIRRRERIGGVA